MTTPTRGRTGTTTRPPRPAIPAAAAHRAAGGRSSRRATEVRVRLRPATPRDVPLLMTLMRGLYAHDRLAFRPRPARAALLGLLRDRRRGRAFVVEAGGRPAGYVVVTLGWSLEY